MKLNNKIMLILFWCFDVYVWTVNFYLLLAFLLQLWACFLLTGWTLLMSWLSCSHSLEARQSRTLSFIFSENMPVSWFKIKSTASVRWEIRHNLTIFCVSFQWKVFAKVFFSKVAGCFLPTAILPKMNFFCRVFF